MNKRALTLTLCGAILATVAVSGTLAYFTDNEAKTNVFTVGNVDIVLNEDFDNEAPLVPTPDPKNHFVKKEVTIGNKGESDAYVRVLFAYEDTKDVGAMAWLGFNDPYAPNGPEKKDMEDRYVIPGGNGDWLQIKNTTTETVYTVGYVTLSEAIAPDETTAAILEGLAINKEADNAWAEIVGAEYDLIVFAQGAQVIDEMSATESINAAFGFTMDEKADTYVAKLFTDAGLGDFVAFTYTSEGAWAKKTAWDAVVADPIPNSDEVGTIIDSNDTTEEEPQG